MSPDPNLTEEFNALFDAEPPLRATPEQVLAAVRGLRRRRQRIAVAGSAIGTVVLVGATAAAAAGLSGGRPRTGPRTATAGCPHRRRAAQRGSWCRPGCRRPPYRPLCGSAAVAAADRTADARLAERQARRPHGPDRPRVRAPPWRRRQRARPSRSRRAPARGMSRPRESGRVRRHGCRRPSHHARPPCRRPAPRHR